jgi:SAM-dependent MidA family methyltransferase
MQPAPSPTPLAEALRARLGAGGPITFADYMSACLYEPAHGYYSHAPASASADYYTSPEVHPIFARLIARQLAEMWERLGRPARFDVVEPGAGDGRLAGDLLAFAVRVLPEFAAALRYTAVELGAARRAEAEARLAAHVAAARAAVAAELPERIECGVILSNELFDALPVHRVQRQGGELREIYVALEGDRFVEQLGPPSTPALGDYFAAQGVELVEGQQAEAGLAACDWIADAGRRLERGFVLTIDYGLPARELYDRRHMRGTLLAYRRHRAAEDWFAAPGEQDLTAHVNFTALEQWGRRAGFEPLGMVTQTAFLLALGRANEFGDLYDPGQSDAERVKARLKLKTLLYPEGMGETFRVLFQGKGVPGGALAGLSA